VTEFRSFNNCTGERVRNQFQEGNLRLRHAIVKRITVIEFGVNGGGGNGASCGGMKVRTDTTKLSDMAEIWSEKVRCSSSLNTKFCKIRS